ncbi:S-adenosyl-L-methionine-dependent methyltransferase [Lobosporangium transversale]|uniref:S-adenosyl-L-methionine-dependent methyltransferase n=1 Tax=Lobosporangium transversale TaxID=64571 RepID=A0A1Y2G830_9FUNG|nr:S-adenosyl-L-methionine-dependent methyltransferase [Lobosporangium transversale]ORY95172.1 S-adenosyl-L-methionine-dependent methyltransferase [Lobosporangium transversale]|eukprot:XP_021875376.1 S-adenosyl-L-methionine-dependent methyltransferase [Lobosporangium transversale]
MEQYYKAQKIMSDEEWPIFWEHLKVTLPTTFRITGTRSHAVEIRDTVKNAFVPHLANISVDGVVADPPRPLPWYPDELGWHFDVSRTLLKKSPEYTKFHQFLVAETEVGNISRQEAVSMIPPLLLDVQPQHWVMDMCAAPGSKTAQIIEMVHANEQYKVVPSGLIVANDADYRRSHMLIHQTKRLQSPCLIVTNHDASLMPSLKLAPNKAGDIIPFEFDRVLADVPCSGDATLRKNPMIWTNWTHGGAMGLHHTQVNILQRGVQMLKVGGRIVYSTCSFNPMENEAVVAEILNRANGTLELVDVSNELPQLKRRPGLSDWKVFTKDGQIMEKFEDIPKDARGRFYPSMWPPSNADNLHLERCLRIYPHLQNTGGFFVAVFKKTAPFVVPNSSRSVKEKVAVQENENAMASEGEEAAAVAGDKHKLDSSAAGGQGSEPVKRARMTRAERFGAPGPKEEPFLFLDAENGDVELFSKFYGLDEDFPKDQFLVRSEGEKNKTIYFVSEAVKNILKSEDIHRLKVVNTGVRTFIRQDSNSPAQCTFRIHNEGIAMMRQFVSDARVMAVQLKEVITLLQAPYPKISEFPESIQERLTALPTGCCIFEFDPELEEDKDQPNPRWEGQGLTGFVKSKLVFPVWKAQVSFNMLLNKQERRSLAMRLGVDCVDSPHVVEGGAKGTAAKAAAAAATTTSDADVDVETSADLSADDSPMVDRYEGAPASGKEEEETA